MSLPEFPVVNPPLTREDAINQIISSIAMEELALSHIINAEGEKLQYILGTIPGTTGPQPTIEQVLEVNESVRGVLQSAAETQSVLRSKLQNALSASVLRGPTGPTGAAGRVDVNAFQAIMLDAVNQIAPGEAFVFNEIIYDETDDDIEYDATTGVFTVNQSGTYNLYEIHFWFYSDGFDSIFPYNVTLNVNNSAYSYIGVPYIETQITSTSIVPATSSPMTFRILNTSDGIIGLPDTGMQAKISIKGFRTE